MAKRETIGGFKTSIWKVLGTDYLRPVLQHAYVQDGFIYATNAYVLLKQDLSKVHLIPEEQIKHMEGKYFHIDLLKELERASLVEFQEDGIFTLGPGGRVRYEYSSNPGKYPNAQYVIDRYEEGSLGSIRFDVKQFNLLVSAMYVENTTVKFEMNAMADGYIRVTSGQHSHEEQLGMLMPKVVR